MDKKRKNFRLKYPTQASRAMAQIDVGTYEVVDISVSGMKVFIQKDFGRDVGDFLDLTICFKTGSEHSTKATIVRKIGPIYMFASVSSANSFLQKEWESVKNL